MERDSPGKPLAKSSSFKLSGAERHVRSVSSKTDEDEHDLFVSRE
jgi:hypothetical protein